MPMARFIRTALTLVIAGLGLITSVISARAEDPQLPASLELVPPDAAFVAMIPNLAGLDQKLSNLSNQLGFPIPPTSFLLSQMQLCPPVQQGINPNGSMILVLTDLAGVIQHHEDPQDTALMLIPVSDYAAFMESYEGQPDLPISPVMLPSGHTGFAKQVQDHAVVGQNEQLVANYQPAQGLDELAQQIGSVGQRCLAGSDLMLLINVQKIAPLIQPHLQEGFDRIQAELDQTAAEEVGMNHAEDVLVLAKALIGALGDGYSAILRDTTSAVIGLDLTAHGIGLTKAVNFKADSPTAKVLSNSGAAATQLAKLTDQSYLMAAAIDFRGIDLQSLTNALMDRIPDEAQGPLLNQFRQVAGLIPSMIGTASAYYPADVMAGDPTLFQGVSVFETRDSPGCLQATRTYLELLGQITAAQRLTNDEADASAPSSDGQEETLMSTVYTADALQIDGVSIDQYEMRVHMPPEVAQEMGPLMMMTGAGGQSGFIAASDEHLVLTTVQDVPLMTQVLATMKQGNGLGTAGGMAHVRQMLPANSAMEMYISLIGVAESANPMMAMFGMPPVDVPADLPPLGMGASLADGGIEGRFVVPMPVILFCKDTYMNMINGGADGAPPPQHSHADEQEYPDHQRSNPPPAPR